MTQEKLFFNIYSRKFVLREDHAEGLIVPRLVKQGGKIYHLEKDPTTFKVVKREVPRELYV